MSDLPRRARSGAERHDEAEREASRESVPDGGVCGALSRKHTAESCGRRLRSWGSAAVALTCAVLAANLFGDAVRDFLDPEPRGHVAAQASE